MDFLNKVSGAHLGVELHVVCDHYALWKGQNVNDWPAATPWVSLHLTPTSCSRLNPVEIFADTITKQAIG